jgi:hypothetical protein
MGSVLGTEMRLGLLKRAMQCSAVQCSVVLLKNVVLRSAGVNIKTSTNQLIGLKTLLGTHA